MTPLNLVLARLESTNCQPRQHGSNWAARCPAHDDRRPSLAIGEGRNGQVLLKCFAGCRTRDVLQALGLSWRDLWPDEDRKHPSRLPRADGSRPGGLTFLTVNDAILWLSRKFGRPVKRWTYRDAAGEAVGIVLRWNRPGGKVIRPLARCRNGWRLQAMPPPRPLFRLPELLAAPTDRPLFLVEGEPAADAARRCGLLATTSAGGAQAARLTDWRPLAGRHVVVLPDNDTAGRRYALDAADCVRAAGAASVRVLDLATFAPELPAGGDLVDVLRSERWCGLPLGDAALPENLGEWLLRSVEALPEYRPNQAPNAADVSLSHDQPKQSIAMRQAWRRALQNKGKTK